MSVRFLSGSTTNRIPYEIVYCLHRARADWTDDDLVVCTALLDEPNYFFLGAGSELKRIFGSELGVTLDCELVQIAFPALYQRFPVFCIPLYHELGHFVDRHRSVVEASEIVRPYDKDPRTDRVAAALRCSRSEILTDGVEMLRSHRREFFADLFAASYTGQSGARFLEEFAGQEPMSYSHPSVQERRETIFDFCSGRLNETVGLLRETVVTIFGKELLVPMYASIDVAPAFSDVRPVDLKTVQEVHGLFPAAWDYLERVSSASIDPWSSVEREEVESVINGLVEKSIRNYMISEGWESAAAF